MSNTKTEKLFETDQNTNILSEILKTYLPFWPVFVITTSLSIFAAFMYLRYQTPIYQSNATILLKDEEKSMDNVLRELQGSVPKKVVENEILMLKSKRLMNQVVTNLGLYAQIYAPGRINNVLAYDYSPVSFISLEPEKINPTSGLVSFTYLPVEKAVVIGGKKYPLEQPVILPWGKFRINYNHKNDVKTNTQYFLSLNKVESMANGFLGNVGISTGSNQSTVVYLSFTDPIPSRSEDILNELIDVYNKAGIDDKNLISANTLKFIDNRLDLVTVELSAIESDLEDYKTDQGIGDLSTQGTAIVGGVQNSDQALAEVQIQISVLEQIQNYVVKKSNDPGTVPATLGISDPTLLRLLNTLYDAELQLNRLRKTSAENSPSVIALKSQIDQIKPGLLENIRNLRENLETTRQKLQSQNNKYSVLLRSIPKQERKMLDITRQQSIKNSIYTFLLQKREETALAYASTAADSRIVNAAECTGYPVKPVKSSMYFFAIAAGMLVAVLFVLLKEKYISEVVFRSEIEKATKATILGEILYDKKKEQIVITDGNRSPIAEQFRSLRTSLSYLGIRQDKKTILFTSSISGDGKTFISLNLGSSLAITNKKVVLLELDLRKPKIAKKLNMQASPGISDHLAGLVPFEKVIKLIPGHENFYIIPAGSIPPNPTELILNGKLEVLLEKLKAEYDYILIDSPPVGLVTDAKLLNDFADVCIYVIRHKHTPKKYLRFVNQLFLSKEIKNLNIVFNGLKSRGLFGLSSTYDNGYGSGYGYGYGEDVGKKKGFFKKLGKKTGKKGDVPG